MLRFFTNRELSRNLLIPLSKWKRWSREFLAPDPLGGLQSGVARRYSADQALTVFIGGHLVAELKISIPEARQIMGDLRSCLNDIGAFAGAQIHHRYRIEGYGPILAFSIFLSRVWRVSSNPPSFNYTVRGLISRKVYVIGNRKVLREKYLEEPIPRSTQTSQDVYKPTIKILPISAIVGQFTKVMKLDRKYFPILDHYSSDA
jgi:hypothetical protein